MYIEPGLEELVHNLLGSLQPNMATMMGIEFSKLTKDECVATMPVNEATVQPFRMLHGGASVALAETLGSVAANFCVDGEGYCVGLEINANHVRSVRSGFVIGITKPIHLGVSTQVWQIDIKDERKRLVCTSRLTMAVKKNKKG